MLSSWELSGSQPLFSHKAGLILMADITVHWCMHTTHSTSVCVYVCVCADGSRGKTEVIPRPFSLLIPQHTCVWVCLCL